MAQQLTAKQNTTQSGAGQPANVWQANMQARMSVLQQAQPVCQQIFSQSIAAPGNSNNVLNVAPRLVGLLKRFKVVITGTANNTGATTAASITPLGLANLLSNVTFTDPANNQRINTTGWHLDALASMKYGAPYGGVESSTPLGMQGYGNNFAVIVKPSTIAANASANFAAVFNVPVSYSDQDLRGAINLAITNATANLALTINPNPFSTATDATGAVYSGNTGTLTNLVVTVYQEYLDQLPIDPKTGLYILPALDTATIYALINSTQTGLTVNQDFPIPYSNFRDYLSTFAVFDNGGTLNGGTDVNYWALQVANYANLFKINPTIAALNVREAFRFDPSPGMYYFSSRHKPISTNMYGNQELILNASTVNAGAQLLMGYEYFAAINLIGGAASQSVS